MNIEGHRKGRRYPLRKRFNENTFPDVNFKSKNFQTPALFVCKSFTGVCNPVFEWNIWSMNENTAFLKKQVNLEKIMILIGFKRLDLTLHVYKPIPAITNTRHNYAAI